MKGKILEYSIATKSGIISGHDGVRYNFSINEWKSENQPLANQIVDFTINEEQAIGIFLEKNVSSGKKSKIVAGLLAIFLGGFGIHKFYLGCTKSGIITLILFIFGMILLFIPTMIIGTIAFIEGILYIVKSDEDFDEQYVQNKKCWF